MDLFIFFCLGQCLTLLKVFHKFDIIKIYLNSYTIYDKIKIFFIEF